jgi:hypothetical protein
MDVTHLDYLIQIADSDKGYFGNNSLLWANQVLPNNNFDNYLNRQFDRYELFKYCEDHTNNSLKELVAIFSWGGLRRNHGKLLVKDPELILDLVNNLRNGKYKTRQIAFSTFQSYRNKGLLPGLGIGYFTKLICFLSPELNGYIMDQWVGKSINLLTGKEIVKITGNNWVNDYNTEETYEIFCSNIDSLTVILNCSGFEVEKKLFSVGRGKGKWRQYLIKMNYFTEKNR